MSIPLLATLFFFSAFAVAYISAPNCTFPAYQWTFNSLGQSPCTVVAYMIGTCNGGNFTLRPLDPMGFSYDPDSNSTYTPCQCTTVAYSLLSACDACQGQPWDDWSVWKLLCHPTPPPSSFPNPVPSGIRVPQWALIDVTSENNWNPNKSYAVGDFPEIGPGSVLGPSGVSVPPTPSSTGLPMSGGGNSKIGAIAGGVVGGIVAFAVVIAAIFYLRRRSRALSGGAGAAQPGEPSLPTTIKFYNPNDPTTFPYQGSPPSQDIPSQEPMSGTGMDNTQTSPLQARGYDGRPML